MSTDLELLAAYKPVIMQDKRAFCNYSHGMYYFPGNKEKRFISKT
ncbi:hypothetical protein [Lacrimispora xylanisolvens]